MVEVSVIMAAYNAEQTIVKSIESIRNQSHVDWELIICDDCSTDNTYKIIEEYRKFDSRIKVLRNDKNMFSAYSRNRCIDVACGKYIAIQDADDYSEFNRLSQSVKFLKENREYSFISTSAYFFDDKSIWGSRVLVSGEKKSNDLIRGLCFIHAASIFTTESLRAVYGYRVSKETRRGQDYDLFMRLYSKGFKGYTLSTKLYYIFESKSSYSRRKFKFRIDECIIRLKGYRAMNVSIFSYVFVLKPILVGLLPNSFMLLFKRIIAKGDQNAV